MSPAQTDRKPAPAPSTATATAPGTGSAPADSTSPGVYDNNGQYSRNGILRYERTFGSGYISTGGPATTDTLVRKLGPALRPGVRVLDVGSGIGGAAFHLADHHGATVVGIDLAPEMIAIAHERAEGRQDGDRVQFRVDDVLTAEFDRPFDIIWSRDALMHIPDKPRLFGRLLDLLVPGGTLVITDYACGTGPGSPEFQAYRRSTGYHLVDPASYGALLRDAGFVDVEVEDATDQFIAIMKDEAARLAANRDSFVGEFSESDLNYLIERWNKKDGWCRAGDMKWGIYKARKPA